MEKMPDAHREQSDTSENDALSEMSALEQQIRQEGAVDAEPDMFRTLREQLNDGILTPREALEQARSIVASRQNYH